MGSVEKNWKIVSCGSRHAAIETHEGQGWVNGSYDPKGILTYTCCFHRQLFTEAEAKRLVDKMNAKGPLVRVSKDEGIKNED